MPFKYIVYSISYFLDLTAAVTKLTRVRTNESLQPMYLHDLSPYAINFGNGFGIRWYGLAYLAGFIATYLIGRYLASKGRLPLTPEQISDFIFSAAIGTIVGGRLGYCIFYAPELLTKFSSSFPFWEALAINRGGMASHGGMLGIIVACGIFARKHKISARALMDLCALGGPIGIFFGRIANFVNGELVGRPAPAGTEWTVKFPQDIYQFDTEQLASLSPVFANNSAFGIPADAWASIIKRAPFDPVARASLDTALNSILGAVQAGNAQVKSQLSEILISRYPSQLYEAAGEGLLLFLLLLGVSKLTKEPGTIAGAFLMLYSIIRICLEQFRLPDPQIGYQIFDLTRGQILSGGMFIFGAGLFLFFKLRPLPSAD